MDFTMEVTMPASAAEIWRIFFDVQRVAGLIPGCENVAELAPLSEYSAVMKQRIGVFRLEVPTRIAVESYAHERNVALRAQGRDKLTGTTIDVRLAVELDEKRQAAASDCTIRLDARMQVAGRLASLGYPVVKKRSEEIFVEFEKRLREELAQFERPDGEGA
jgi:carbon monoxide dehydrogenase subunit G